ncbi:carbohydrate-binding module family 18 protein [Amylocarpus encephaloides]|uniref:Carbohydrate-binding module family 18 protein n=1 Tax=Amylocarpus encephaloides TaxID=45428 RepID=A0A9P7YCL4_9HELO|nr:carbohydrate-binding module family 18 protein [Amylocarpus encephaloides]
MKVTILSLGLAATAFANIIFNHAPLKCDLTSPQMYHGCLFGQDCRQDGTYCGSKPGHCLPSNGCQNGCSPPTTDPTPPRSDGHCGKDFGGAVCDPKGKYGQCCSQYGFCGKTDGHCLASAGCQNGCSPPTTHPTPPRSDGRCGKDFGGALCDPKGEYGQCCSQYGFCGKTGGHCLVSAGCQNGCSAGIPSSTMGEPVIAPASSSMPAGSTSAAAVTTNGSCGVGKGNTVCGSWPQGSCCSAYSFCGSTSAHCGEGCQSGPCLNAPAVPPPGPSPAPAAPNGGSFRVVGSSGVPAMHAALLPNGRVMFLDKLENYTELKTANGYFAMSSEYDPATNKAVPLAYQTNAFCAGGSFLADGRVVSVGGNGPLDVLDPNIKDGFTAIRYLSRSSSNASLNGNDWREPGNKLASARWYPSVQTLGDGRLFVASGSLNGLDPTLMANNNPTYEILSANAVSEGKNVPMEILVKNQPYYMYPFIHLMNDGNLFVAVSKAAQIFNVGSNAVVKELPDIPGLYRTYPNTGGSVMMPLSSKNKWAPDIIICGGGSYQDITSPTDPSCGRIKPLSANPAWEMESMPEGRGMVEGTLLADGTIVWLNGGNRGAQGFGLMQNPTLEALMYDPAAPRGQRFHTLAKSTVPRLYHSVALLMLDGTLMVTGSNPVEMPKLKADAANPYGTEFRVEKYTPPYLQGNNANKRPTNIAISSLAVKANGSKFTITFTAPANAKAAKVSLYHGGFVTHSVHMGHRMLDLDVGGFAPGQTKQTLTVTGPPNSNVAPPGPYVVYVLCDGVPGMGQFVRVS